MKNFRTSLTARTFVVGAAFALALAGGASLAAKCAYAFEGPTFAQEQVVFNWTVAGDSVEAARASGLRIFGAPTKIVIADNTFVNPTYASAGNVAQATYEHGALAVVLRKTASDHQAPLTDRLQSEFATNWHQDVDGIDVALWGAQQGEATVISWNNAGCAYGVTYQGLGGDEVTMNATEVANIVRAVRDANPAPQASKQAQSQPRQQSQQTTQTAPQATQSQDGMISSDAAIRAAVSYVAGDNNVSNTNAQLVIGGDAPHFVVTFHFDDADYTVEVDAYTGAVWSAVSTFNDGTRQEVQKQGQAQEQSQAQASGTEDKSQAQDNMISSDAAISAAISAAGVSDAGSASASLSIGGDAPHYDVSFTANGANYYAQVDAYTGAVWSVSSTGKATQPEEKNTTEADTQQETTDTTQDHTQDQAQEQENAHEQEMTQEQEQAQEPVQDSDASAVDAE
ncbi:MAG: PepSY domain-containing protein [Atopobiaceae bacterium]|nr:PepSY domain-containing protein [Atopobiaceae bacterium]